MSTTMNTKEFSPALTLKYLTSSHQLTIDEGDEVALAWFDDQWRRMGPIIEVGNWLVHRPVARAITLSSVH